MENKTSWKTLVDWKTLSSSSLIGERQIVTIKSIQKEEIISNNGKKQIVATCRFADWKNPMAINKTNFRTLEKIFGTDIVEDWYGKEIIIFRKGGIKFGKDIVEGIRIKPLPKQVCNVCGKEIDEKLFKQSVEKYGIPLCSAECKEKANLKIEAEAPTLENLIENMEGEENE